MSTEEVCCSKIKPVGKVAPNDLHNHESEGEYQRKDKLFLHLQEGQHVNDNHYTLQLMR